MAHLVQDFVSAVMDVDYSPTGREFVAGGYDRSVRIFAYNGGHSREVYHTKRMQRVFAVRFSGDASYVFSGSDDMNVRVWKACTFHSSLPFASALYLTSSCLPLALSVYAKVVYANTEPISPASYMTPSRVCVLR